MCDEISRERWHKCLKKHRTILVNFLRVEDGRLLNKCLSEDIISDQEVADIKAQATHNNKTEKFWDILLRINMKNYLPFLKILHELQQDIADDLAGFLGVREHLNLQQDSTLPSSLVSSDPGSTSEISSTRKGSLPIPGATRCSSEESTLSDSPVSPQPNNISDIAKTDMSDNLNSLLDSIPTASPSSSGPRSTCEITVVKIRSSSVTDSAPTSFPDTSEPRNTSDISTARKWSFSQLPAIQERKNDTYKGPDISECTDRDSKDIKDLSVPAEGACLPDVPALNTSLSNAEFDIDQTSALDEIYRLLEQMRNEMRENFDVFQSQIKTLKDDNEDIKQQQDKILRTVNKLSDDCEVMNEEVKSLKIQYASVTKQYLDVGNDAPILLIGDQLLQDIHESSLHRTQVVCVEGGTVSDILNRLRSFEDVYAGIVICVGTNNCGSHTFEVDEVVNVYRDIIKVSKRKVPNSRLIRISSVLPRSDKTYYQSNVEKLNTRLREVAHDSCVNYIDNDLDFRFNYDKSSSYIQDDGVLLTKDGTKALKQSLRLPNAVKPKTWLTCVIN